MTSSYEYAEYTGQSLEWMPRHIGDERQPMLRQPVEPNTVKKQQIGSKRSIMLCDQILDQPARRTIEVLLELRKDCSTLAQDSLSQDARIILRWRRELQSQLPLSPRCTELEEYARELSSMFVENFSRYALQDLTYDTRLKLAIIFWHFADPDLFRGFLRSPINKTVWERLYADYLLYSQQDISYLEFIQSFDFLLSPQLPKRLACPLYGGSEYHRPQNLAKRRRHPVSIPQLQSTGLQSPLPLRPDASDRPTLPPIREVLKGVCAEFENIPLDSHSTSQPTSDLEKYTGTAQSKLTMNDQDLLMSHTNVQSQDRLHPPQTRAKQKVRFELPLR